MTNLSLLAAQTIVSAALAKARDLKLRPVAVAVLDARGALKAAAAEDGTSLRRFEVALGKANGALALGLGSRSLLKRAQEQPFFLAAVGPLVGGMVPVPGGVLVRDDGGAVVGAVGISGDTSDSDEAAAVSGIFAARLLPDPGSDA